MNNSAILLVQCPDRKGLDATIAGFIYRYEGNILHFEQHQDAERNLYFVRIEWDLGGFQTDLKDFPQLFAPIAEQFQIRWQTALASHRPRVAIFVSKYDLWFAKTPADREISNIACCHLTAVLL
jgi:formyltetrahydrofolate deformylase